MVTCSVVVGFSVSICECASPMLRRVTCAQFFGNLSIGLAGERFQMVKNEFEVVHVPRFREPDIVQFADAVDVTHRIYTHRFAVFDGQRL